MVRRRKRYLDNAVPVDNTSNVVRPVNRMIQVKQQDTPARREKETREYKARQEIAKITPANSRQASIGPYREKTALDKAGGRLYAAAEQRRKDAEDKEAAGVVLNSLFKPILPSTYVDMAAAIKNGQVDNVTDALAAPYLSDSWSMRNPGKALAFDIVAPVAAVKGAQLVNRGTRGLRLARTMNRSLLNPDGAFYNDRLADYTGRVFTVDNPYRYNFSKGVKDYFYNGVYPQRIPKSNLTWGEKHGFPKGERNVKYKLNPFSGKTTNTGITMFHRTNAPLSSMIDGRGNVIFKAGKSLRGQENVMWTPTSHWTTDQPVLAHQSDIWNSMPTTIAYPMDDAIYINGMPLNIEPMDTYFAAPNNFILNSQKMRVYTSDPAEYIKLKQLGVNVEFSQEGRMLQQQYNRVPTYTTEDYIKAFQGDKTLSRKVEAIDREKRAVAQANDAVHRQWANQFPKPELKDYEALEQAAGGKKSGVRIKTAKNDDWYLHDSNVNYYNAPPTHSNSFPSYLERLLRRSGSPEDKILDAEYMMKMHNEYLPESIAQHQWLFDNFVNRLIHN